LGERYLAVSRLDASGSGRPSIASPRVDDEEGDRGVLARSSQDRACVEEFVVAEDRRRGGWRRRV
jgi:hypothetical protein